MVPPYDIDNHETVTINLNLTLVSRPGRVQGNDYEGWYCSTTGDSYDTLQELVEHQLSRDVQAFVVRSVTLLEGEPPLLTPIYWRIYPTGAYLVLPPNGNPLRAAYAAYTFGANACSVSADSFASVGAKITREVTARTLHEAVGMIMVWAKRDGYDVPPFPGFKETGDATD